MSDAIDISEPLKEICDRLSLHYESVTRIVFEPSVVSATVLKRKENGAGFLEGDEVAVDEHDFKVST
jgi:hypothetical protein